MSRFKLYRQLEFGQEFSWEMESSRYRTRLWVSTHLSGYFLTTKNSSKVTNQRAGGEAVYDLHRFAEGTRIGLMAFGYIDWMALQTQTSIDPDSNDAGIDTTSIGATLSLGYVGLGLTLGW